MAWVTHSWFFCHLEIMVKSLQNLDLFFNFSFGEVCLKLCFFPKWYNLSHLFPQNGGLLSWLPNQWLLNTQFKVQMGSKCCLFMVKFKLIIFSFFLRKRALLASLKRWGKVIVSHCYWANTSIYSGCPHVNLFVNSHPWVPHTQKLFSYIENAL